MTEAPVTNSPPPADLAAEVGRLAPKIKAIHLVAQLGGSFRFDLKRMQGRPKLVLSGPELESSHTLLDGTTAHVEREFVLLGRDETDNPPVFEIRAKFQISYDLAEVDATVPDPVLQAFGDLNSRFNLTAYWREYVQSCCARAGLPPLPISPYHAFRALQDLKGKPVAKAD